MNGSGLLYFTKTRPETKIKRIHVWKNVTWNNKIVTSRYSACHAIKLSHATFFLCINQNIMYLCTMYIFCRWCWLIKK